MKAIALADFGSTYTKVTLVDEESGRFISRAQAPTTSASDVLEGYRAALDEATAAAGRPLGIARKLHASSAGGGLRMVAVGLVEELTAAAAKQAALNAGARVQLVLAGTLDESGRASLTDAAPEILLFAGGTDGGQEARVLANAEVVASADLDFTAVVACNSAISKTVAAILHQGGRRVRVVPNVMPAVGRLQIEPARRAIGEEFVQHVIRGKGLSASRDFDHSVAMPTPEAVLRATRVLTQTPGGRGPGGVVVVDVGGATTDIHSFTGTAEPHEPAVLEQLLPPPPLMRTVQGDLGVRWNAPHVYETETEWIVSSLARDGVDASQLVDACRLRANRPEYLGTTPGELAIDRALATSCVAVALRRHCGSLRISHSGRGPAVRHVDGGPDLREASLLVGSGGVLVHDREGAATVTAALARRQERSLTPTAPSVVLDKHYILPAAGLLSTVSQSHAAVLLEHALTPS